MSDYPRWLYHRTRDPIIIHSEAEEAALGREWSRLPWASLPREEKPEKIPAPEPEEEPEEESHPEPEPEEPEEPVEEPAATAAPPAKPKRGRPAAHKKALPSKTTAHKRR